MTINKPFTLADAGLPSAEHTLLQTILRLSSDEKVAQWQWLPKDTPATTMVNVLLADGQTPLTEADFKRCQLVLFIGTPQVLPKHPHAVLGRPIRAEAFLSWLATHTPNKLDVSAPAPAVQPAVTRAPASTPAPAPSPAPAATAAAPAGSKELEPHIFVKLLRWPASDLLGNDPARVRMATLLSRRAMSAVHLSKLSGQNLLACKAFIQDLYAKHLLTIENMAMPQPGMAGSAAMASTAAISPIRLADQAAPAAKPTPTFFASLRQRLGL